MNSRAAFTLLMTVIFSAAAWLLWNHARLLNRDAARARKLRENRPPEPVLGSYPRVSTLVAAWNEGEDLDGLVKGFRSVDYPNKELVLAVGGAHDLEKHLHLAGTDVSLIEHPGISKNAALARCLEKATGNILHLTDADCRINSNAYIHLLAQVINGEEQVATGRAQPYAELRHSFLVQMQWSRLALNNAYTGLYTQRLYGRAIALTRSALATCGGFEPRSFADDYYLGVRLLETGHRLRFVPESVVETAYPTSLLAYMRQRSRWSRGVVLDATLLLGRYKEAVGPLRGACLALATLVLTASVPFTRKCGLLMLLLPVLRLYLTRVRQIAFAHNSGRFKADLRHYVAALPHLYVDMIASAGTLFEYAFKRTRYRW